mmetsp:Transcript_11906/g.21061  ORF Transcript_11906/g.21061 Transcript_11906/m.21061 type:complete len:96 (+) Transcript_11906:1067-1354(+)
MGHKPSSADIEEAEKEINQTEGELNFEDFSAWYKKSLFWTEHKHAAEEAAESQESILQGIQSGWGDLQDPETVRTRHRRRTPPSHTTSSLRSRGH